MSRSWQIRSVLLVAVFGLSASAFAAIPINPMPHVPPPSVAAIPINPMPQVPPPSVAAIPINPMPHVPPPSVAAA